MLLDLHLHVRRLLAGESANGIAADLNRRKVPTVTAERWLGRHLRSVVTTHPDHPVAVEIARRLTANALPRSIAADLNARGVPKPIESGWRGGNLRILVQRPAYAGLRCASRSSARRRALHLAADHHRGRASSAGRDVHRPQSR